MFFPLHLSPHSSAFSSAGTASEPLLLCHACGAFPTFWRKLAQHFTISSKWLVCQQQFSSKACHDLCSSGADTQSEVLLRHVSQEK